MPRQTTFCKKGDVTPVWHHVDAQDRIVGRVATEIALVLMGKHRPTYTPHVDCGDYVVVTNAASLRLTGKKAEHKARLRYTGYPGGLKSESFGDMLTKKPEELLENAVRRMLPKNRLGRQMLDKLKIYRGSDHPHQAQQPAPMTA